MKRNSTTSSSRRRTVRPSLDSPTLQPSTSSRSRVRRDGFSYHWIFRSNIPKRQSLLFPNDIQKRNFFGMGEVFGVLANPAQTLKSLTEAKSLLEQTRNDLTEARERAQIKPTHTFSPLPPSIFFPRPTEVRAIENILMGQPSWTVIFGASSTGKTAILRHVLSNPRYHILHFDLRIAGFADLASLQMSLCQQMEQYFAFIGETMEGYGEFEAEALAFKHERMNLERRLAAVPQDDSSSVAGGSVKTSDIARLMEMFQSSLLKYRDFEPFDDEDIRSDTTHVEHHLSQHTETHVQSKSFWRRVRSQKRTNKGKERENTPLQEQSTSSDTPQRRSSHKERRERPEKKVPVIFFDEAHKLPTLIQSTGAMKCLLDAMLVLTKQDRLCHVIHATSEPFYQTWLRKANVMQHCKILTLGDCPKSEMRTFFRDRIIPHVPEKLRMGLLFDHLWDAFGGKLAHWQDYITDYVNANGKLDIKQSSHFLQAHALLNLHIIHSSESPPEVADSNRRGQQLNPGNNGRATPSGPGFRIYSPLTAGVVEEDDHETADFTASQLIKVMVKLTENEDGPARALPYFLLCKEIGVKAVDGMVRARILDLRWTDVVKRSNTVGVEDRTNPNSQSILQLHASHSQIHSRTQSADVLRIRGGATYDSAIGDMTPREITPKASQTTRESRDIDDEPSIHITEHGHVHVQELDPEHDRDHDNDHDHTLDRDHDHDGRASPNVRSHTRAESATTMINPQEPIYDAEEGEIVPPLSEVGDTPVTGPGEQRYHQPRYQEEVEVLDGDDGFVGPKLLPATPIMRYAMRVVVGDYYVEEDTVSEYASLSDVNEY